MRYRSPAKNTQKTSELPGKITAYLKENPGARMYNIVEAAKASRGAVTYQLRNMISSGEVSVCGKKQRCYYLTSTDITKEQIQLNEFKTNETKSLIITELQKNPKMTREELSEILGIKKGTLYRHLASLEKAGILKRRRDGHCLRYEVSEKTLLAMRK